MFYKYFHEQASTSPGTAQAGSSLATRQLTLNSAAQVPIHGSAA
jgi:hypothetical protein